MDLLAKGLDLSDDAEAGGDLECLGAKPQNERFQKENLYNQLLPYDVIPEQQQHLVRIKSSLAKAVLLDQETVYEWFIDLERYIDLYGLAFNKDDHIFFVKLQYQMLVSEDTLDLCYIAFVARCFAKLMKKRYLIGSDELQLDWRPLYDTYDRLLYSENEALGLRFIPETLESNLSQAIRLCRPHFPLEATQEMLDEWRPLLCPYDGSIQKAVTFMNLFLPTTLPPEHHDKGFKLWFDEVMQLWLNGKVNSITYESKFTLLLSRLSSDCLGFIDWEPYIPKLFNHFKTSLNLNGGSSRPQVRRHNDNTDVMPSIQWVVYMISTQNSCLNHISMLFKAIESFYHPSNTDRRWHGKLQQILYKLPACYVKRLYRERHKNNIWSKRIPESYKLTDKQTEQFVDSILPVALTSMFSQTAITSTSLAFRDLSVLSPAKVVPPLLERLYGSCETLTEPHRLLASINCMSSAVPAMVRPSKNFPEGPSHVVQLLLNSLPGIDSNDMRKCIAVFRFVATLAAHIRLRNYSYLVDEKPNLSQEQQQLCLSTAGFEDFVIQFLDKSFLLIENTASSSFCNLDQENQLKNGEEGIIEAAISSVTLCILSQASPEIQQAALDKLYSHVTRHIFDTKTQGKAIATLCLACAKASPERTLGKFVPHFGRLILTLTDNEEIFQESILDDELLFSILLLSEIVRCNSRHILSHKEIIIEVLNRTLRLSLKDGYLLGCSVLRHLLRALTNIACCDWRNIDFDDPENRRREEEWPFDNWGHMTSVKDLKLKWEIPGPESRQFAQMLLETYLRKSVQDLLDWSASNGQQPKLSREHVQRSLHIILSSLVGAASVLPNLVSQVIDLCPIEVPTVMLHVVDTGTEPLNFSDGTNIRTWIVESMEKILNHILASNEDDAKSLTLVCEIYSTAILYFGYNKTELRLAAQRIKSMKASSQNKLLGPKRNIRYLLVERVAQQHRAMLLNKGQPEFTERHLQVITSLFDLSQSHHPEVRILAQDTAYLMMNYFPFSESVLVPVLVRELSKPEIEHKKFKGLLYLVLGRRSCNSLVIYPHWSFLKQLWPAIISSPHSEKPSIVKLLDRVCGLVQKGFDTFELRIKFSDELKSQAKTLWSNKLVDTSKHPEPDQEYIEQIKSKVDARNNQRVQDYEELVVKLARLIDDPHLHWHRRIVAYNLFAHLMRDDHPLPLEALELCLSNLISERLSIRTKAIQLVAAQLKLLKRKHATRIIKLIPKRQELEELESKAKQISISEQETTATTSSAEETDDDKALGKELSASNKWLQYKMRADSYTQDEWDKLIFVDKPHIGFYDWPKELKIYEPYNKQPQLNRSTEQLSPSELAVYRKFTDADFVSKLVNYFCFEDNKGSNDTHRFDLKRPAIFKGLFRNYGPCLLDSFKKYVLEYASCACEYKQKFVIELVAGLLRGSKHWSLDMLIELQKFVLTVFEQVPMTQENFNDWVGLTNYVFRDRDVRRFPWLLSYFVTKAIATSESASINVTPFVQGCRLILAHYSLTQCEWRAIDHIFPVVIEKLKPQDHLLAYANVRNCLASIYSLIYMFDDPVTLTKIPETLAGGPKRVQFIEMLLPKLAILEASRKTSSGQETNATGSPRAVQKAPRNAPTLQTSNTTNENPKAGSVMNMDLITERLKSFEVTTGLNNIVDLTGSSQDSEERKDAIKLMKLTSCWLIYNVCRMKSPITADYFKLLPVICEMGRETSNPELAADSLAAIALLGTSILSPEATTESLLAVRRIIANHSWHARSAAAFFIEIMVSSNLFKLLSNEVWRAEIEDIVINHLICDERIEVRESSSLTLSGMIHCEFTILDQKLLAEFKRRSDEPLIKRKQQNGSTIIDSKSIVARHSGILCLCACVDAHPYTVPEFLPDILTLLSDHLTDPQPISTTIKKTMSNFRRTHHDNWQSDKTKFTNDQLSVLANLLVSPSYYA